MVDFLNTDVVDIGFDFQKYRDIGYFFGYRAALILSILQAINSTDSDFFSLNDSCICRHLASK